MALDGKNLTTVREENLRLVLRLLLQQGKCSRSELAKATGLKQATMTHIVNLLLSWDLVCECGSIDGRVGRKSIAIAINPNKYRIISVRVGRKNLHIGVFSFNGSLLEHLSTPLPEDPKELAKKIEKELSDVIAHHESEGILGVGIALPGIYGGRGASGQETQTRFLDALLSHLSSTLSLPVFIENDANCGALAKAWYAPHGTRNLAFISVGAGVGAGIIVDGALYRGAGGNAGEIGHVSIHCEGPVCYCGNRGCLELYCSENAFLRTCSEKAQTAVEPQKLSELLLEIREDKNPVARELLRECAVYLGCGIVNLINSLDPERLILSGRLVTSDPLFFDTVRKTLEERIGEDRMRRIDLEISQKENETVLLGATVPVADSVLFAPSETFSRFLKSE